jgi:D-alanine-D-alanine ligase
MQFDNKNIRVTIIFTDYFSEIDPLTGEKRKVNPHDLSEASYDAGIKVIEKSLKSKDFIVNSYGVRNDLLGLIKFLKEDKPDVIFNLCESFNNEATNEMHIAGLYELLKISYTGASSYTLGLLLQKARVKELLQFYNYHTPKFAVINNPASFTFDGNLSFPLIVKPSREDASVGISNKSIVYDLESLKKQINDLFVELKQPILVEEYIEGRELNIAVMGDTDPVALPISEIDFTGLPEEYPKIVTFNAKWMDSSLEYIGTKGMCPAKLDPEIGEHLRNTALNIFKMLKCRDYARVDLRLDKNNKPYILEVNPNPDLSSDAGFYRSARTAGFNYEEMLEHIVHLAFKRKVH